MNEPPLEKMLKTLRDEVPPSPRQDEIRAAFLAAAVPETDSVRLLKASDKAPEEVAKMKARRRIALMVAAVFALLLVVVASPDLRALAQELIELIIPGDDDSLTVQFYSSAPPTEEAAPTQQPSLNDAPFAVHAPTFMPENYQFEAANYYPESHSTWIRYQCGVWGVSVSQRELSAGETPEPMEVGASAEIQSVQVGDTTALYVRGEWLLSGASNASNVLPGTPQPIEAVWNPDTEFQRMVWQDGDMVFSIFTSSGLVDEYASERCALTKEDFVAIANSLTAGGDPANQQAAAPESLPIVVSSQWLPRHESDTAQYILEQANLDPGSYETSLTWQAAVELLGVPVPQPELPEGFELQELAVNRNTQTISAVYTKRFGAGDTNVQNIFLTIWHEQAFAALGVTERTVGSSATVEQIAIGNAQGEHANGIWQPQFDEDAAPGEAQGPEVGVPLDMLWVSDAAYRRIRWAQDGLVFELAGGGRPGEYITLEELAAIASSMHSAD